MKRMRKLVLVLLVILIVANCLAGCNREVTEDSNDYASVWYNEKCINIYSPISSTVALAITVENSGQTITIGAPVEIAEHQNKTIMADDLNVESFNENAKIISVDIIKQTYKDMTIGYCIAIAFGLAIALPILFFVSKVIFKILRFYLDLLEFLF